MTLNKIMTFPFRDFARLQIARKLKQSIMSFDISDSQNMAAETKESFINAFAISTQFAPTFCWPLEENYHKSLMER